MIWSRLRRTPGEDYLDKEAWTRRAVQTVARMGYFSSDRSIHEYCQNIWHVAPMAIGRAGAGQTGSDRRP